jgi:hypothetical protein
VKAYSCFEEGVFIMSINKHRASVLLLALFILLALGCGSSPQEWDRMENSPEDFNLLSSNL